MAESPAGSYCCPHGLASYVYSTPNTKIIFSGLRIRGVWDKKKAKSTESTECVFNTILSEENCLAIAKEAAESLSEKGSLQRNLDAIKDLLHETRSLNGQVKNTIDQLLESQSDEDGLDSETLLNTLKNVHVCSYMISNRFAYFDSVLNPTLSTNPPLSLVIFRKFDKMRKLLKGYMRKNVWISLNTPQQSDYRYPIYQTFEILLFILFENAIKYSPDGYPVNVNFAENGEVLDVTISSIGPYCDENELLRLCQKGFRGENAKALSTGGQGFGLNFAKQICETHNIGITFSSNYLRQEFGIKYGTFTVNLHFDNTN